MQSLNGTYVDGKKITSEMKVRTGSLIGFGLSPKQSSVSDEDFIYSLQRTDKNRDDELFNFKNSEIDLGLKEKIADIINLLDDEKDFDEIDKIFIKSSSPKIEKIMGKINSSLSSDKNFKTEMKTRKRRRHYSPLKDHPKRIKLHLPSMWDEVSVKNAKSVVHKTCFVNVAKLPESMKNLFQTFALNSLKEILGNSIKQNKNVQLTNTKRCKQESKNSKKSKGESKGDKKMKETVIKKPLENLEKKSKLKELLTPLKKSKTQVQDDLPWSVKSPKFTKKLAVSPKARNKNCNDYEEFVEYRGAELIADLVCSEDESSEEEVSPNNKRRYSIKVENTPINIKSILSPKQSSSKSNKKINFCSEVFIKNFDPSDDLS